MTSIPDRIGAATRMVRDHRLSPFRRDAFDARLHNPRTATVVGRWLGVLVVTSFFTGEYSHLLQHPPAWLTFPTDPPWLYQVSQGLHVASGTAAIPLLLAKLWTVYPRLFTWPPVRSIGHAVERLSIFVFVAATVLELFTGFLNTVKWYLWPFSFPQAHYALAWVIVGSLLIHIGVKLPLIVEHWRRGRTRDETEVPGRSGWTRRGFLSTVAFAVGAVTVLTVGQTVSPLSRAALLAPRRPDIGPQGLPINRTAGQAQVVGIADDPGWRLEVTGPKPYTLTLAELNALPQTEAVLPIACVEGWSSTAAWAGVRVTDLVTRAGGDTAHGVRVVSMEKSGGYRTSVITPEYLRDDRTLLALRLRGEVLHLEHGYPARIIAPGRPGVLQTKWVQRLEVLS